MAKKKAPPKKKGFTPFKAPVNPPPGTYDPSIDAQVRASGRGYGDLSQDYTVGKTRAQDDYLVATGDLTTSRDRSLSDLLAARSRAGEDYNANIAGLDRSYLRLGDQQTQAANAAGVLGGGVLAQALAKRTANEAIDRAPIDTNYNRYLADSQTQESRLGQDYAENADKLSLGLDRAYGTGGDQTIALARAGRENTQLGIDATEARWGQARGTGYVAPQKPASEHTDPRTGQVFRLVRTPSGQLVRLLPSGQTVRRPRYSLRKK